MRRLRPNPSDHTYYVQQYRAGNTFVVIGRQGRVAAVPTAGEALAIAANCERPSIYELDQSGLLNVHWSNDVMDARKARGRHTLRYEPALPQAATRVLPRAFAVNPRSKKRPVKNPTVKNLPVKNLPVVDKSAARKRAWAECRGDRAVYERLAAKYLGGHASAATAPAATAPAAPARPAPVREPSKPARAAPEPTMTKLGHPTKPGHPMRFTAFGATSVGRKRQGNEDAFSLSDKNQQPLFVVADGMGGHDGGEVASAIVVEGFKRFSQGSGSLGQALDKHLKLINQAVSAFGQGHAVQPSTTFRGPGGWPEIDIARAIPRPLPNVYKMGATVVAAAMDQKDGGRMVVAHSGDARAYWLTLGGPGGKGSLKPLTVDHSPVATCLAKGELTEAEARVHPYRNVIDNAVGLSESKFRVELTLSPKPESGSALLLCSDGLNGELTDADILRVVQKNRHSAKAAVQALIDAANTAGGRDNITCILVVYD